MRKDLCPSGGAFPSFSSWRRNEKSTLNWLQYFPLPAFDDEIVSTADVSRYVEDPGFGYKDFARRGEEHLPTFRAQVRLTWCSLRL